MIGMGSLNLQRISKTSSKKPRKTAERRDKIQARFALKLACGNGGRAMMGSGFSGFEPDPDDRMG